MSRARASIAAAALVAMARLSAAGQSLPRASDGISEICEDSRHEGERDVENILSAGRKEKAAGVMGIHEHRREGR